MALVKKKPMRSATRFVPVGRAGRPKRGRIVETGAPRRKCSKNPLLKAAMVWSSDAVRLC